MERSTSKSLFATTPNHPSVALNTVQGHATLSPEPPATASQRDLAEPVEDKNTGTLEQDDRMPLLESDLEMENMSGRRTSNEEGNTRSDLREDVYNNEVYAAASAREGERQGYKNFIRKSIANGILIALW